MALYLVTTAYIPRLAVVIIPLLFAAFLIVHLVFTITASIKAGNGELYRYPLAIRFIK